ncbi:kinase-like domain-containing protein [Dichomitus squalens]|nr:kinase-like domain-containing protein [Dichomitus squalens]
MVAAKSLPNFIGTVIGERYHLTEELGSGSYGVVYKAVDLTNDNLVAVKVIRTVGRSPAELATIKREVALHSVVAHHESVVGLIDAFDTDEYCYMILEYIRGGDLFEQIVEKKSYQGKDELLRRAFVSLVDAVQACHDAKIAHRDLKPENILTSEDGSRLYLADFGLAMNQKMASDCGRGTSIYMSPEATGELTARQPFDPYLNDIWALGVILVNMITRQNPWSKATSRDADFSQFIMGPEFLLKEFPMSKGAFAIIREILDLHPAKRISLRALRKAILSLDTFFRLPSQRGYVVREHEHPTTELATSESELRSTTEASEIDITCTASEPLVRVARDCSAGSAVDLTMAQLGLPDSSSCPSSRASSGFSDEEIVITPEGTTFTTTSFSSKATMWERMMVEDYYKEVRGGHGWQNGSASQILEARYRYREVQYDR